MTVTDFETFLISCKALHYQYKMLKLVGIENSDLCNFMSRVFELAQKIIYIFMHLI